MFGATFHMWLALASGVLGAFTASALAYRKIHVYDIIFSAISVIIFNKLGWHCFQLFRKSSLQSCCSSWCRFHYWIFLFLIQPKIK